MFKPLRLVYLEATPEKGQEALTTKNFLGELKKFGYNKEKAKEAVCKGALAREGGYKLIKAEALFEAGKLKTISDLDNAAAESLSAGDVDDFLNKYGGDKYVKRLFVYGVSKMERDFAAKKQNFKADKRKGGAFEGLKKYETFEDAFNAGFYKEFAVDINAIMEKGLSVSEYRQRDERFKKLEKKVKQTEEETGKYPEMERPGTLNPSPTEPIQRIEHTPPGPRELSEKEKEAREKERKLNMMLMKLGNVAEAYRQSDVLIPALTKKYALDEITSELGMTPLTENPEEKNGYEEKFITKIKIEKDVGQMGKSWYDFIDDGRGLRKEIVGELKEGHSKLITERLEKLTKLETALYVKGDGSSDPRAEIPEIQDEETRKAQEAIRLKNIEAAEAACPETKDVRKLIGEMGKAASNWRIEMIKLETE